jgi:hypothetical protein
MLLLESVFIVSHPNMAHRPDQVCRTGIRVLCQNTPPPAPRWLPARFWLDARRKNRSAREGQKTAADPQKPYRNRTVKQCPHQNNPHAINITHCKQISYQWWARQDLNLRPSDYEFENRGWQAVTAGCRQLQQVAITPLLSMVYDDF